MPKSHLINANIHRAKEGARVLEDIARFILRDKNLFCQIREIRHRIQLAEPIYSTKTDLGGVSLIEDNIRDNLMDLIQANALRVQEALRVLEEMAQIATNKRLFKELRYKAYDIQSNLYYSAKKYLKLNLLKGLYLIIDTDIISNPINEIIEIINKSSINIVQYRNKSKAKKMMFEEVYQIKQKLNSDKLLIINDHIDLALDLADGIHIGQHDYPLSRIRNIIPSDFVLGISCHNIEEADLASQYNISYIAIGSLFETKSKKDATLVSNEELQKICNTVSVPVCAIGGININNLDQVLIADIKMAALISSVWKTDNPLKAIQMMHEKIMRSNLHNK